jgi:hypothetical protein
VWLLRVYDGVLSKKILINLLKLITRHILAKLMRLGLKEGPNGFRMHTHI